MSHRYRAPRVALLAGLLLHASVAGAQPRSACDSVAHKEFDFWIGSWIVSDPGGNTSGTSVIESVSNGCAILEQWRGGQGTHGTSINFFDPATQRWNQLWVGGGGAILRLEGSLRDGAMELTGTAPRVTPQGTVLDRIRWTPLADGTVEQLWLLSTDNGATWTTSFRGIYRRKSPD